MPCYNPIAAVQPAPGAVPLIIGPVKSHGHLRPLHGRLELPCQKCSGCLRRRSLEWAMRCVHEAQLHRYNCYITLTYDDKHLPANGGLLHKDFVNFSKALRNRLSREVWNRHLAEEGTLLHSSHTQRAITNAYDIVRMLKHQEIRFYMAGEYGDKYGRPHYHALLFGLDFADKIYHGRTKAGEKLYQSPTLSKIWGKGYASIGSLTFASAAYISRYVMKKRWDDGNKDYEILDLETGEIIKRPKEYNCMSRAQGIGKNWWEKYKDDVITIDKVITKSGRRLKPPRYYDKQLEKYDAAVYEQTKLARELESRAQREHHTPDRLAVQEIVENAKARFQTRNLE